MRSVIVILSFFVTELVCIRSMAQTPHWQRHTVDASLSGADGVRLADINKDGLMDITTGWEEGGLTKVYLHPGYHEVERPWPAVIVGETPQVEDAVFVDVNQDGYLDVVSSTEGDDQKMYVSFSPANVNKLLDSSAWRMEVIPASADVHRWMFAIPAQIDGQFGIDIVAGAKNNAASIGWFQAPRYPQDLSAWAWHPVAPVTWVMSLFIRDMDRDGDLDIVTSDRKPGTVNGVKWLENPGQKLANNEDWMAHPMAGNDEEVMFMDMIDLDGDGLEDAIVTERLQQKIIFIKRLDNSGLRWQNYYIDIPEMTGRAKAVKVGDIDGDGRLDLVHTTNTEGVPGKSGVIWGAYKKEVTDNEWTWHDISGLEGYKFDRIELIDLDGDGDLDVLTCEENYGKNSEGLGVIWYENPAH